MNRLPACFLALLLASAPAADLAIIAPAAPRAFFFRSAESLARNGKLESAAWDACFSRLQGIIGKCLDEEIPGTMHRNPEVFRRFKQAHPDQVVLLHFNGNACDPRFAAGHFPGHWIHRAATLLAADVPAETGETVIRVENARDFRTNTGRYRNRNDDIALFAVGSDGRHDWSRCEQVELLEVDTTTNSLRVRRACHGTRPLAFRAGMARAAAHMTEGPWGKDNHLLWFYNHTTHCPRDQNGKTAAEVLVERFAAWFGQGGPLEGFDGVEFDVMHHVTNGDTDGDGSEDDGIVDGVNRYGAGMIEFACKLRQRMGPSFIIQGDGALGEGGTRSQRAFHLLNGIESEGWPNIRDWEFRDWSGGLNRHDFWHANAHPPAFSYINHKWIEPVPDQPGQTTQPEVPFARHRLALAGAVLTDSAVTFAFAPPRDGPEPVAVWDELIAGTDRQVAWLGRPLGPAVHLATRQPDLLAATPLEQRAGGAVSLVRGPRGLLVKPRPNSNAGPLRFTVGDLPTAAPDLLVTLTMSADRPAGWPAEMARVAKVSVSSGARPLLPPAPETLAMKLRGQAEHALDPQTGASARFLARREIGGVALPCLAVHPPYKAAKGAVLWSSDEQLSRPTELRFSIGMGERSPQRSDGVSFKILVAPVKDGVIGEFEPVFEESTKLHQWLPHTVSLDRWTGQRVRLKFVADCGPADNATTDHAHWGDVRLLPAGLPEDKLTKPESHMTWAGATPFASSFYFRDIRSPKVDLEIEVENDAPVTIHSLTAHAFPDLMAREFEHGLVLANPSPRPQTVELSKLFPHHSFRRLKGTPKQDPATNDGSPVGPKVTLGALDALFLKAAPRP